VQLILRHHEILPQQRDIDDAADRRQVFERPVEKRRLGQDRDGRSARDEGEHDDSCRQGREVGEHAHPDHR